MSRAIASSNVLLDEGLVGATVIFSIESGKIIHIEKRVVAAADPLLRQYNVLPYDFRDVSPMVVMPGLVDAHVHINEPGRTDWEGFATGTQAAAAGGVTTLVDMPLNAIPPTTTAANFNLKISAAKGQTWVDVGFWGGMVPDNLDDLRPLINMGVRGFKGFLIESGVDEFPAIDPAYILRAMQRVKNLPTLLMFHAEMQPHVEDSGHADSGASFLIGDTDAEGDVDGEIGDACDNCNHSARKIDKLGEQLASEDFGMSASFIKRAPEPVVDILSSHRHPSDIHEDCKLPHNHAGSIDHSVLSDDQAVALAHSQLLASAEPAHGKYAKMANHQYSRELEPPFTAIMNSEVSRDETTQAKDISFDPPLSLAQKKDSLLDNIDPASYASFLASRPDNFETTAIAEIINCSTQEPSVPLHIVHLATHEAVPLISAAKARNLPISAETCFHYLSLSAEKISNCCTHFKCCPPIRTENNRRLLWKALRSGLITTVVSDHSPCTPELKGLEKGDFFSAWGGISSLGFGLSIMHTEGAKLDPPVTLKEISEWCSWNTAKQVGMDHFKGKIKLGYDADLILFDPGMEFSVMNQETYFKNKLTAYDGMKLQGRVVETIIRGNSVYALGQGHSDIPMGRLILEPRIR